MKKDNTYYITTPIYYTSGDPHIGHAYCTLICDAMARYKEMQLEKDNVYFLTGTDEHGQKVEQSAQEAGKSPKEYVDGIVEGFEILWEKLNISHNKFIRTTDEYHEKTVQGIFSKLWQKGDIYKGNYEGWYCTPCEASWTESQLKDNNCPDCNRAVEKSTEECYFFRLSNYTQRLIDYIEANPDFIQPASRKNEMINNFLKPGLDDLCVSRTSFTWGVKVPFDEAHVIYVWIDALPNYISALGYGCSDRTNFEKFWRADENAEMVHLVGKEINRFHTIIWPAILMSLDLPLPKTVYAHGWWTVEGEKMSKSRGNVIDPAVYADKYGVDATRYVMLREMPFGSDADWSHKRFVERYNNDLANDLGNLLSRTIAMVNKYFNGSVSGTVAPEIVDFINEVSVDYMAHMDATNIPAAMADVWKLVGRANKYIDETMPWNLAKDEAQRGDLANVMVSLLECLYCTATWISPFMPFTADKIQEQLGGKKVVPSFEFLATWMACEEKTYNITAGEPLFPRIDITTDEAPYVMIPEQPTTPLPPLPKGGCPEGVGGMPEITIDDFAKLELCVVEVLSCEPVQKSDRLLCLQVNVGGGEMRQVVSGIASQYQPGELVGRRLLLVKNLKPVKLRGVMSQGMILCAEDGDVVRVIDAPEGLPAGATVR